MRNLNLNKLFKSIDDLTQEEERLLRITPRFIVEQEDELNVVWHDKAHSIIKQFEDNIQLKKARF